MTRIQFNNRQAPFYSALKERVDAYFEQEKIAKTGNLKLYSKAIFFLSSAIALYITLVFFTPSTPIALVLCGLLGISMAGIGFNVMHDGAHGSFSSKKWINEIMAHTLNALGGSAFLWKAKHNGVHHTFTNIHEMDDDIDISIWMRVHRAQKHYWFHRFQSSYWVILYGFTYLLWVFVLDFGKYFSGKIASTRYQKMPIGEHIGFWFTKMMYLIVFFAIPIWSVGLGATLLGYLVTAFICGLVIAVVFQLAHVVSDVEFPEPDEKGKIATEWAVHQVATTANFSTSSKPVSFFMGGLNFQVEHHLFPKISHIHYPALNKIIRETCEEFNIKYVEYSSVWQALQSHVRYLHQMSRPEPVGI